MSDFLEYPDVQMEVKGTMADGKLKLTDEKLVFKVKSGSKQETVAKEEIEVSQICAACTSIFQAQYAISKAYVLSLFSLWAWIATPK